MQFSEKFEKRFAEWLTHYPTKRSVLVPSLLYAQDELGHLTADAIAELAGRLGLTVLEVNNVITYYSLLTRKPKGKFNVQVRKLGIGHKQVTADGRFSLEEVECIGACSWGPAVQVYYDYHEKLTPEQMEQVIDQYAKKDTQ